MLSRWLWTKDRGKADHRVTGLSLDSGDRLLISLDLRVPHTESAYLRVLCIIFLHMGIVFTTGKKVNYYCTFKIK